MKMKLKEFVLENEKGGKVTVSFDGSFTPESIMEVLEKFQDNNPDHENRTKTPKYTPDNPNDDSDSKSIREKLELIVNQIKYGWFISDHVKELYQNQFHEEIKPSTVSTYLARMFNENALERRGSRAKREYHLIDKQVTPIEYIKTS